MCGRFLCQCRLCRCRVLMVCRCGVMWFWMGRFVIVKVLCNAVLLANIVLQGFNILVLRVHIQIRPVLRRQMCVSRVQMEHIQPVVRTSVLNVRLCRVIQQQEIQLCQSGCVKLVLGRLKPQPGYLFRCMRKNIQNHRWWFGIMTENAMAS